MRRLPNGSTARRLSAWGALFRELRVELTPLSAVLVIWVLGMGTAAAQDSSSPGGGLSFMTAFGPKNYSVVALLYGTIVISLAAVTIIGILVLVGTLLRGRRTETIGGIAEVPLERPSSGLAFIYVGTAITTVVLFASAIWNYVVLADVASPPRDVAATMRVTGHQWWWQVAYTGRGNARNFTTANEIHIPVGRPVRIELTAADVIHSFWVPALTGKTDTIPGQQNVTWMQADKPGIYRGQCTEYCGQQHAHMGFVVVAESQQQFDAWWSRQLEGPKTPNDEQTIQAASGGQAVFMRHCAVCHTVRGTLARGIVGPDLSHVMERRSIAAATLPNSIGALSGWISDPQHIKPGNLMPTLNLTGADLNSLRSFLLTLQ